MKPNRLNPLFAHLFSVGFAALIVVSASAAEISYKTTASSTNVGTLDTNWIGGVLPGSADVARWTGDSRGSVNFSSAVTWGAIRANDADGSIAFSGSTITLAGLSAALYGSGSVVQGITEVRWENFTVGNNIALGSNQTWNIGFFSDGTAGAPMTLNGTLSGAFDLTKVGAGTLNLTANNSGYTNTLTSTRGTLNVAALGGSLSVSGGTVNSSGALGGSVTVSGATTALNLNSGAAVGGSVTFSPGGVLGLNGGSINGNLTLNGTSLNRTSSLSAGGNIIVSGTQAVNISIPSFGAPMTILSAGGTLSDTDDANPANNFTVSNASTFRNAPVVSTTSKLVQVTIAAGAAQTWTGSSSTTWNANSATNWSGTGSLFLNGDAVTFDDTATPATPVAVAISGLLSPSSITFNNSSKAYNVTGAGSGNGITGATGLIKNGTGVLTLGGGGSTYTGNVQVNAGTLKIGDWEALGASGKTISVASGAALDLNGNLPSSSGRHYTWSIAGDGVASSGAITNSGGNVFNNAGILNLSLTANASIGGTGRFDLGRSGDLFGTINGGGFTLTKNGTNQLTVRAPASNITYVVNTGALVFEDSDAGSGTNTITVNGGILGTWAARTISNNVNFTAAGAVLRSEGGNGIWSGNIALNGNVTFRATDVLTLTGNVTGSGAITKDGGNELRIGNGGTTGDIGTNRNVVISAGSLVSNRSDAVTLGGDLSGAGGFSTRGAGTTTLTGNNTYSGDTRLLGGGVLSVATVADGGGVGALGTGSLYVENNSTLRITGSGTQTSNRTLWWSNASGGATVDVVDSSASVVFTANNGNINQSLTKTGAGSLSINQRIFNSGSNTVTVNGGTLQLNGANVYVGATSIRSGMLVIGSSGSLANTAVTVGGASSTGLPTLAGGGTIAGATVISSAGGGVVGTHSPGIAGVSNGVGTQTFSNTLNYQTGSIFQWDLRAASTTDPGVVSNALTGTYDKVVASGVAGSVTGSNSIFRVVLGGNTFADAFWNTNKSWTDIYTGLGAPTNLASIFTSFSNDGGLSGGDGTVAGRGQFTLTGSTLNWTAVPEPTTALVGILLGAGLLRRRRSR